MMNTSRLIQTSALVLAMTPLCLARVRIDVDDESPQSAFAATEIRFAVARNDSDTDWQIRLTLVDDLDVRAEGFRIVRSTGDGDREIHVRAKDHAGLMYGGLEVAEVIRTLGIESVRDTASNPYLSMRGTKFNIPLDVRTPSYTDVCDAAQLNIPEMWDFKFWKGYIDALARHRYNYVSLWNLHPFPSLVKVPEYPDVALDDVWRSKATWDENYSLNGLGFVTDEILSEVEVVKRLSIDEKIEFWKRVMAYGKSRNVDFYVITWNIFTDGTDGKYGITDRVDNETTTDYFRRSVAALLRTYPDLAGIGLTTGENLPGVSFRAKEDWAMATYGQGVMDVVKEQPDRKIRFIHRQHQAKASEIAKTFRPLVEHPNVDFIFSFKYAKAHVYSATQQPYHTGFVEDLGKLKTIWTLRNDDVYYFRWGAADFVREFVKNIPYDVSQGYYFGSDQFVWGREFLQRGADQPRQLEVNKHWFQWLLWGRFAYDPDLSDSRLQAIVAERLELSAEHGQRLFDAWQHASMVYPITTGFHWGALDFQWYIEGCESRAEFAQNKTGFHDVNRFINLPPHAMSGFQSIPDYAKDPSAVPTDKQTPLQVAESLDRHCSESRKRLERLPTEGSSEFQRTVTDIRIVTYLGDYYADKIRGAAEVAVFRQTQDEQTRARAIGHLADAARHWHAYASLALQHHKNPLWTNRVGFVDWKLNYRYVLDDIRIAGGDPDALNLPRSVDVEAEPIARPSPVEK